MKNLRLKRLDKKEPENRDGITSNQPAGPEGRRRRRFGAPTKQGKLPNNPTIQVRISKMVTKQWDQLKCNLCRVINHPGSPRSRGSTLIRMINRPELPKWYLRFSPFCLKLSEQVPSSSISSIGHHFFYIYIRVRDFFPGTDYGKVAVDCNAPTARKTPG